MSNRFKPLMVEVKEAIRAACAATEFKPHIDAVKDRLLPALSAMGDALGERVQAALKADHRTFTLALAGSERWNRVHTRLFRLTMRQWYEFPELKGRACSPEPTVCFETRPCVDPPARTCGPVEESYW